MKHHMSKSSSAGVARVYHKLCASATPVIGAVGLQVADRTGLPLSYRVREGLVPLTLHVTDNDNLYLTDFGSSDLLLLTLIPSELPDSEVTFDFCGTTCKARLVCGVGVTYVYYVTDQVCVPMTDALPAVLSRHFMNDFNGDSMDWTGVHNAFYDLGPATPNLRISDLCSLPITKVSGTHHVHLRADEVWVAATKQERSRMLHALRLPGGCSTVMVAGVMLWLASLSDEFFGKVIETDLLDGDTVQDFIKSGKKLSVRAKSLQNIVSVDMRQLFEVDVLSNRAEGAVDWETEHEHRANANVTTLDEGLVYEEAVKLFARRDATARPPINMSWSKFWDNRWQWSAAGSIHSQYPEDMFASITEQNLKNKFINLIMQPNHDIDHYLSRQPSIHAWSSVKYEWGKMRAIYGTDLTSYVLAHFAFYNCEDVLPNNFPVGRKATPSYVKSTITACLKRKLPLCIDFEDFNSMHSVSSMRAVLRAFLDVNHTRLSDDQIQAAMWTIDSIPNQIIHDNMGTGKTYRANGTLLSGWRLTTFVNSVLNYIYTRQMLRDTPSRALSVHNGDDVLLGVSNFATVQRMVKQAQKCNIRLQRAKCAFGGIAEFLRIDHRRGGTGQYMTRAIATLVHSRIESKIAVAYTDAATAHVERTCEAVNRGASKSLLLTCLARNLYRVATEFGIDPEIVGVITTGHRVVGGMRDEPYASVEYSIVTERRSAETELPPHLPGVLAYAQVLKRELKLEAPYPVLYKNLYATTLKAVLMVRTTQRVERVTSVRRYVVLRALYKAHADSVARSPFGKAMLVGMSLDILRSQDRLKLLSAAVRGAANPLAVVSLLS